MEEKKPPDSLEPSPETEPEEKSEESTLPAKIEEDVEFQEFLKSAPPPMRGAIMQFMRMQGGRPPIHPIFDKFSSEHVTKFLDYSHADDVHEYTLARQNKWFHLIYAIFGIGVLVFLVVFLLPRIGFKTKAFVRRS